MYRRRREHARQPRYLTGEGERSPALDEQEVTAELGKGTSHRRGKGGSWKTSS